MGPSSKHSVMLRTGRETFLRKELEWVINARDDADPLVLLAKAKMLGRELSRLGSLEKAKYAVFAMFAPDYGHMIARLHGAILHGRLLSAELRGAPWPIDSMDPDHHPLRRVERDGMLMGGYSLNASGSDAQGHQPNRYFALYGLCDPPPPAAIPGR